MQENVPWTGSSDGTNLLPQNGAKNPSRIQNASFNDSHVIMISTCNICQYLQQHPTLLRSSRKVTQMWRDLRWIQLLEVEIRRRSMEDCKNDHQNNEHFKGKVKGWRIKEDQGGSWSKSSKCHFEPSSLEDSMDPPRPAWNQQKDHKSAPQ